MQRTYANGQAPRHPGTRPLQKKVLKKRERNSVLQIREECDDKTASPQRYTQEPCINNVIFL